MPTNTSLAQEPMNITADSDAAVNLLATQAKALGDPIRLRIYAQIASALTGETCVCDIVERMGRTQATVSHHLKILREAELISGDRRGTWVWYRANPQALMSFLDQLKELSQIHKADSFDMNGPTACVDC